jgi:hypothetical protein
MRMALLVTCCACLVACNNIHAVVGDGGHVHDGAIRDGGPVGDGGVPTDGGIHDAHVASDAASLPGFTCDQFTANCPQSQPFCVKVSEDAGVPICRTSCPAVTFCVESAPPGSESLCNFTTSACPSTHPHCCLRPDALTTVCVTHILTGWTCN